MRVLVFLALLVVPGCSPLETDPVRRAAILGCIEIAESEFDGPEEKALKLKEAGCQKFSSREINAQMPTFRELQVRRAANAAAWEKQRAAETAAREKERELLAAQKAAQDNEYAARLEEDAAQMRATLRDLELMSCLSSLKIARSAARSGMPQAEPAVPACLGFTREEIETALAEQALQEEMAKEKYQDIFGPDP